MAKRKQGTASEGAPARSGGRCVRRMLSDLGSSKRLLIACVVAVVLSKICLAVAPMVAGSITDAISSFVASGVFDLDFVGMLCLVLAALYLAGYGTTGFVNKGCVRVAESLAQTYRMRMQRKLNKLPISYLDRHPAGDIQARATDNVTTAASMLESTAVTLVEQFTLLAAVFVMMLATDWRLTLIYVVTLPLTMAITLGISKIAQREFKSQLAINGDLAALVSDTYANHQAVKAFSCEKVKESQFDEINGKFFRSYVKSRFISGFVIPLSVLLSNFSYIALCVVGGVMLVGGQLSIGEFQAFIFFGNMVSTPLSTLASSMTNMQNGLAALERIYEFLDVEEETPDAPTRQLDTTALAGAVEFDHVRFGYTPDKTLMKDVSLRIEPGTVAAIVGPSGAGKTTLINLLMRFYDIDAGAIRLDGCDINAITREGLRSQFGIVLQDSWVFTGTIAENIAYGKPNASREEIESVAARAGCASFIEKLPQGYDTMVSEESSALSAGEKQLLCIARTILSDPKILILDEATSQVDTKTEYLITRAMEEMMRGKTSFMIAHRLFTIRNADIIIFMVDGDIKEVGSHDELIARRGLYASMYNSASLAL